MIRTVIIEDEKKSTEVLTRLLQKNCPDIIVLGKAETVKQAINLISELKPELLFLDILLPDGNGFDVLERITNPRFDVIFITASDQFAVKAIKYSAMDYLLKPIDSEELINAVRKVVYKNKFRVLGANEKNLRTLLENVRQNENQYSKITLPAGHTYEIVLIKDIIRCEANDNYTFVFLTEGRKFLVSGTLKHYEDLLPEKDFIRVHHSHLINMNHLARFLKEDGGYAVMSDGSKVEVSRRKREHFLGKFK